MNAIDRKRRIGSLVAGTLVGFGLAGLAGKGFATEQSQQRQGARDVKQDGRQQARDIKY